jgi:hypothetical protein
MVDITVLDKISFKDIEIKTFHVSCRSHRCAGNSINFIGILFLKCPANVKTIYNNSIKPGYIHIKSVGELLYPNSKTLHQQCFENITSGNKDDFLILGFSFDYDLYSIKLNSSTFNLKLSQYFNESNDREGMEFFTPILQTVMKKYIVEREVGFTLNVEHIPRIACLRYTESYPDVRYEDKEIHFETRDKFYDWCRLYYKSTRWFSIEAFELLFNAEYPDLVTYDRMMRDKILILRPEPGSSINIPADP